MFAILVCPGTELSGNQRSNSSPMSRCFRIELAIIYRSFGANKTLIGCCKTIEPSQTQGKLGLQFLVFRTIEFLEGGALPLHFLCRNFCFEILRVLVYRTRHANKTMAGTRKTMRPPETKG